MMQIEDDTGRLPDISLRICHAMPNSDLHSKPYAYRPTPPLSLRIPPSTMALRAPYAMSGTDTNYEGESYEVSEVEEEESYTDSGRLPYAPT
eukprot:1457981-Rhodomonas_salina.1